MFGKFSQNHHPSEEDLPPEDLVVLWAKEGWL
jgi:hypothetical protein